MSLWAYRITHVGFLGLRRCANQHQTEVTVCTNNNTDIAVWMNKKPGLVNEKWKLMFGPPKMRQNDNVRVLHCSIRSMIVSIFLMLRSVGVVRGLKSKTPGGAELVTHVAFGSRTELIRTHASCSWMMLMKPIYAEQFTRTIMVRFTSSPCVYYYCDCSGVQLAANKKIGDELCIQGHLAVDSHCTMSL